MSSFTVLFPAGVSLELLLPPLPYYQHLVIITMPIPRPDTIAATPAAASVAMP